MLISPYFLFCINIYCWALIIARWWIIKPGVAILILIRIGVVK